MVCNRLLTTSPSPTFFDIAVSYDINDFEFSFQVIDKIINHMTTNVKAGNLQTLTQITSVIGRATADPDEVSLKTQVSTILLQCRRYKHNQRIYTLLFRPFLPCGNLVIIISNVIYIEFAPL